jgi:hypothetical protein
LLIITILNIFEIFINMGRNKIKKEDKKQSISIAINPELLGYYKKLHINLSSLINKLLDEYKDGNKNL